VALRRAIYSRADAVQAMRNVLALQGPAVRMDFA